MNTKNINTEYELNKLKLNDDSEQTMYEVFMKNMITSCFTYGGVEKESYNFTQYIQKYRDNLTDEVFEAVYKEQTEYLKDFAVKSAHYVDAEGGRYNSLQKI